MCTLLILEPLPVVSNQGIPFCATAAPVHKRSLAYAISVLGTLPNVSIYMDGAHATWLGWPDVSYSNSSLHKTRPALLLRASGLPLHFLGGYMPQRSN